MGARKKRLQNLLLLVAISFLGGWSAPAQVSVEARAETTQFTAGDRMRLRLQVSHAPGVEVLPPDLEPFESQKEWEVLEEKSWDTVAAAPTMILHKDLFLTVWDSGSYEIPRLAFVYRFMDTSDTLFTRSISVEVNLPPVDTFELTPIQTILEEPATIEDVLTHPLFVIVLGLAFLTGAILLLRRKKAPKPAPQEAPRPAQEVALQKLQALEAAQLWQQGRVKDYHSELTYIFREYLENRFEIRALEQTTPEILRQLPHEILASTFREQIQELLQTADLVKFAKAMPTETFHLQAMEAIRAFVKQTPPPVVEEEAEDDPAEKD